MNWTIGNDTPVWMNPRRTIWFIYRWDGAAAQYVATKTSKIRTWKSKLTCEKFYNKMMKERAVA